MKVRWVIKGTTNPSYRLSLQVYDFSGNLVSFGEASAARQGLEIPGWEPEFPHYQVRILLVDGERILDEQSRPVFVKFNREEDLRRYQVILWSNEYGSFVERFRCQIFRRLGIDALASPNPIVLKMASEEGLRMVPTNICVPPNAYKAGFNKDAEKKKLQLLVKDIYRYAPLGYSLADEPSEEGIKELKMKDLCDFRDWAAEIIHQDDKGARVGYCGVWWGLDKNVCKYFSHCDFVEAYSPFHLYTPNLWLGVERDLYRSFVRPDGLITCWTHYAPEKDLEPYSRTVPWLWLFEGLKGVSYFASAGEGFGILTNEWHSTHETRWWSEEIKEIKKGIGEQIIGMERDVGSVRILFHPSKNKSAENWAFALNRLNIPYKFICSEALEKGLDQKTKLLICPDVQEVSDVALEKIQEFTGRGGWIVISGPFAILKENKVGEAEKTKNFLGISQGSKQEDIKKWEQDLALHKAIPSKVRVVKENIAKLNLQNLAGLTTGINCIELKGARIIGEFEQLGDIKSEEKGTQPEFIKRLFLTPAITVNEFGQGKVIYLTFTPTIESAGLLLSEIGRKIELNKEIGCTIEGQEDDTVFLYPFKDREKLLVGVIQNYYRLPPSFEIAGHESELDAWESKGGKETVNYFHHGPYLWKEREGLLKVKENRYIYDVRRGLYKGFGSEVKFNLKPGNPELLAFLPYRINSLSLSLPEKLKQGEVLKVAVYLKDSSGLLRGSHVVNLELVTPENELFKSYNLHTEKGKGEKFILIPFNAPAGRWTITARDALTGMVNKKALSVEKAKTQPVFVLSKEDTRIEKVPLAWPQGNWVVYKKKEKIETPEVKLDLQPLTRKRMWISKEHSGHEYLTGSFTLTNAKMAYGISYSVCNDWKSHGWEDERKIWAPYLPGLGIVKPQSHIWYYNGYIQIFLDDFEATGYRLADIKPVESGENKRVDVLWETPRGKITLSFLMMPEHPGIFQKLSIKSDVPTKKVTVRFRSYPEGFSSPGKSFVFAEDRKRWAVLGDEINDRAFGRGRGPGAILLVPEEWTRINFDPHNTRLEKDLVADSSETNFHWVLWLFPEMTNKEAIRYMNQNADQTITKLKEVYP